MKLVPFGDKILVTEKEEMYNGTLIIPDTAKGKSEMGVVIEVGDGILLGDGRKVQSGIKVGDTVLFDKFAGQEMMFQGTKYLILRSVDIIGFVKEE